MKKIIMLTCALLLVLACFAEAQATVQFIGSPTYQFVPATTNKLPAFYDAATGIELYNQVSTASPTSTSTSSTWSPLPAASTASLTMEAGGGASSSIPSNGLSLTGYATMDLTTQSVTAIQTSQSVSLVSEQYFTISEDADYSFVGELTGLADYALDFASSLASAGYSISAVATVRPYAYSSATALALGDAVTLFSFSNFGSDTSTVSLTTQIDDSATMYKLVIVLTLSTYLSNCNLSTYAIDTNAIDKVFSLDDITFTAQLANDPVATPIPGTLLLLLGGTGAISVVNPLKRKLGKRRG